VPNGGDSGRGCYWVPFIGRGLLAERSEGRSKVTANRAPVRHRFHRFPAGRGDGSTMLWCRIEEETTMLHFQSARGKEEAEPGGVRCDDSARLAGTV
jgi:hypothetical protein